MQVRRATAGARLSYAKGSFTRARAMLRCPSERERGRDLLREGAVAPSTWKARRAKEKTLRRMVRAAGIDFVPITVDGLELIGAALKAGKYRSAVSYLTLWEQLHRRESTRRCCCFIG